MWISVKDSHPRIDERSRAEGLWLFEEGGGIFRGYYAQFGADGPMENHEYGDDHGPRRPSHFWDGVGEPQELPRLLR